MPQQTLNVADLKLLLLQRRITKPRFRWPLTKEQANTLLMAAYAAEVEIRHRTLQFDEHTKKNVKHVAELLTADVPKFGFLFCGKCGNGKTTMLYAFQQACNYLGNMKYFREQFPEEKISIPIVDARELVQVISKNYDRFTQLRSRFMLGLEDIGREPTEILDYGNVLNPVIDLLEYRYDRQLFTVITTNLTPKQISEKYGQRIADRFREMMEVVVFENQTYRDS